MKKVYFFEKKTCDKVWSVTHKFLPLHSLLKKERPRERGEKKSLKFFPEKFGGLKKSFYLCNPKREEEGFFGREAEGPQIKSDLCKS